jgi:hypothetical protein
VLLALRVREVGPFVRGSKFGGGGVARSDEQAIDRRERLRKLALETIDLAGRPTGEVRLVLLALRVREVGPFVRVQGEAQPALQPAPSPVRIALAVNSAAVASLVRMSKRSIGENGSGRSQ